MTSRVRRDGAWARKDMHGYCCENSERFARYSVALATAGIRTPVGAYDEKANAIVFPWIEGISARELLLSYYEKSSLWSWAEVSTDLWIKVLKPLVHLHRVDPQQLDLAPLHPWRRILPRLQNGLGRQDDPVLASAWRIYRVLREHWSAMETQAARRVTVHGDYHVGQILFESPASDASLLDLDDLALDLPESDLGNFVAHLVTSGDLHGVDVFHAFQRLQPLICDVYAHLANTSVDAARVDLFGAVTLLRRTLKHIEYGADTETLETMLTGARSLSSALKKSRGAHISTPGD